MAIDIISKAFDERTGQTVDARAAEAVGGMLRALPQEVLDRLPDEWNLTVKFRRSEPPAPKGRGIDDGTAGPSERDIERGKSLIRPSGGRVVRFAVLPHAEPLAIECPGGGTHGLRVALLALEYLNADRTGNMKDPATGMALVPEVRIGHVELSPGEFQRLSSLPLDGESVHGYDFVMALEGNWRRWGDDNWYANRREFSVKSRKAWWQRDAGVRAKVDEAAARHAARLPQLAGELGPWGTVKPLPWPEMLARVKDWLYGEPLPELPREAVGWKPPTTAQFLGLEQRPDEGPLMAARVEAMVDTADHADNHQHLLLTMLDGSVLLIRDSCDRPLREKDCSVGVEAFMCWDKVPPDSLPTFFGACPLGDSRCRCRKQQGDGRQS